MTQNPNDDILIPTQQALEETVALLRSVPPSPSLYTDLYDIMLTTVTVDLHTDPKAAPRLCHRLAGLHCVTIMAARRIISLEAELKAVKEIFNLP